jgi:uncharacterized protein with HEPN domain
MSLDELAYVKHILDEALYLQTTAANLERSAFLTDPTLQRAFVRSLEIMGEASKHISEAFRTRHPSIPWRAMAGMRDRMIHDYLGVDYEIVWDVVKNKVPVLRVGLQQVVERSRSAAG